MDVKGYYELLVNSVNDNENMFLRFYTTFDDSIKLKYDVQMLMEEGKVSAFIGKHSIDGVIFVVPLINVNKIIINEEEV